MNEAALLPRPGSIDLMRLRVESQLRPEDRELFQALAQRQVNGKSALLNTTAKGQTLLDIINDLQTCQLPPGLDRQALISGVIQRTLCDPNHEQARVATQGGRASCVIAVEQYIKCDENPADYARIVRDLATSGRSGLANGGSLQALKSGSQLVLDDPHHSQFRVRGN